MIFSLSIVTILCAIGGVLIAGYIHRKKRLHEPLTCPIGTSCDPVIHSRYSRFLDMPVEILGVIYYTLIVLSYALFLTMPATSNPILFFSVLGLSGLAFIFSLYLIAVQLFILRQWCTWCIFSAALCTIIFFAEIAVSGHSFSISVF